MTRGPEAGWARLSSGLINDHRWLECDAHGRLVFVTSIALAKAAGQDGVVSLRAMTGVCWGAMTPDEVEAAAQQLVDCGLWEDESDGLFRVSSFLKWNESSSQIDARANRKRRGALVSHHRRGLHDTSKEHGCPECFPDQSASAHADPRASAVQEHDGGAVQSGVLRRRRDADETRQDKTSPTSTVHQRGTSTNSNGDDARIQELANNLIDTLGYTNQTPDPGELRYITRALNNGWTDDDLYDAAAEARTAEEPRQYWRACLRRRANNTPNQHTQPDNGRTGEVINLDFTDITGWQQAWTQVQSAVRRHGSDRFLTEAKTELDPRTWTAARDAREPIRHSDETAARLAFRAAYNAQTPTPPHPA